MARSSEAVILRHAIDPAKSELYGGQQIPEMHEEFLLVLQIDGTDKCSFFIEESNTINFAPKSLAELIEYFEKQERVAIEIEKRVQKETEKQKTAERERNVELIKARIVEEEKLRQEKARVEEKNKIVEDLKAYLQKNCFYYKKENSFEKISFFC